jgi:hypothetical protein
VDRDGAAAIAIAAQFEVVRGASARHGRHHRQHARNDGHDIGGARRVRGARVNLAVHGHEGRVALVHAEARLAAGGGPAAENLGGRRIPLGQAAGHARLGRQATRLASRA